MASADGLRLKIRNRAAASVRIAGNELVRTLRAETPRSQNPGKHTADQWSVTFSAASPTVFVATIANTAVTDTGIPIVTILNKGRREVTPVNRTWLRWEGPDGTVFAKRSKAVAGTGFYDDLVNPAQWHARLQVAWQQAA